MYGNTFLLCIDWMKLILWINGNFIIGMLGGGGAGSSVFICVVIRVFISKTLFCVLPSAVSFSLIISLDVLFKLCIVGSVASSVTKRLPIQRIKVVRSLNLKKTRLDLKHQNY